MLHETSKKMTKAKINFLLKQCPEKKEHLLKYWGIKIVIDSPHKFYLKR